MKRWLAAVVFGLTLTGVAHAAIDTYEFANDAERDRFRELTKELRCTPGRDRLPLQASLSHCLLVARAFGLVILDGVHLDLADDEGFAEACRQGAAMGFDGKTLIHPKTIDAANRIFAPNEQEAAWAETIVAAYEAAIAAGQGLVVVDGKLIENLHVEGARRILALTRAIRAIEAS